MAPSEVETQPDRSASDQSTRDQSAETAARLALAIGGLNRRMLRATAGLSHGMLSALASIVKVGPLRLGDLAQREGIAAATVTRLVAHLESLGLVAREVDASDRRAFFIEATAAGIDYIVRARSDRADVIAALLADADPSDVQVLKSSLPSLERLLSS